MSGSPPSRRARSRRRAACACSTAALIIAAQWSSFGANNDLPAGYLPATGYELVNLYLTWNAAKDITLHGVGRQPPEPVLPALRDPGLSSTDGTTQNDVLCSSPGPGSVYKAGLKIHLGGA